MRYFVFDDVLCVNLDHRQDRWKKVQKDFAPVGMQLTRIPAVYGKDFSRKVLGDYTSKGCKHFCPKSAIGCAMSHRKAWQTIVDKNLNTALILEDDAYPLPGFVENLKRVWSQVPSDWDIVYLGGNIRNIPQIFEKMGVKRNKYINENVMIPGFPCTTHAYAVSKKGVRKILAGTDPVRYHIDVQLALLYQKNRDIKVYSIKPDLINQINDTEYSDNQFGLSKGVDDMLKKIKIGDNRLDVMANMSVVSVGDCDLTAGRLIIVILALIFLFHGFLSGKLS